MTQNSGNGPTIEVKPQPDVYTVLLVVSIIALGMTLAMCLQNLLTPLADGGYGLEFGQLLDGTLPDVLPGVAP